MTLWTWGGEVHSVDSRTMALYSNVILPFRTLSPVRYFSIPSDFASRVFPAPAPFAVELDVAAPFVPCVVAVAALLPLATAFAGPVTLVPFAAAAADNDAVATELCFAFPAPPVPAAAPGFSFCAATSFFHFFTVSLAKSATRLSS